jgi:flavin-dependent dehydrogenase
MTHHADVIVVGGGPSGSVAALLLSRLGRDVLLLDRARFPRLKACGECLDPGAVATLHRLGLGRVIEALSPARLLGWDLTDAGGSTCEAPFPTDVGPGWGISRAALDTALLTEARAAGVRVGEGARVTAVAPRTATARAALVELADGSTLRARCVVGADGLRSVVARSIGALRRRPRLVRASLSLHLSGVALPPDRGRLVLGPRETLGLAPLDAGGATWNLTLVRPRPDARALPRTGASIIELARTRLPGLDSAEPVATPLGSGPFDWPTRCVGRGGVVLVGDAAGYFDPLTGQGIFRALRSAELAAPMIDRSLSPGYSPERELSGYQRRLTRAFAPGRRLQRVIDAVVRRPRLLAAALPWLERAGVLTELVAVTGDARPARVLLEPRTVARLALAGLSRNHSL